MGDQKRRLERFKGEHPWCCFCGGVTPTASIDHQPAAIFFALKRRPNGLLFPACLSCNAATSRDEQVAALMARMLPDPVTEDEKEEVRGLFRAVSNNHPGLLEQLLPNAEQQRTLRRNAVTLADAGGVLSARGPLVRQAMHRFGTKLALALHYEFTGNVIPPTGGVCVRWFSNYDAVTNGIPQSIFTVLGEPMTLEQGRWSVPEQFHWYGASAPGGTTGMFFAAFRRSFAMALFTKHHRDQFPAIEDMTVVTPGSL